MYIVDDENLTSMDPDAGISYYISKVKMLFLRVYCRRWFHFFLFTLCVLLYGMCYFLDLYMFLNKLRGNFWYCFYEI